MDKLHQKTMLDLQRMLKTQDFKNIDEAKKFMDQLMEAPIPSFDKEALTQEEQAQDLVYDAIEEEDFVESDKKIFMALVLDPDCVEAYEYMAESSPSPLHGLIFFKNGCTASRKKLGEKFFLENKGHFWGIHETRPYMRCLVGYGMCLYAIEQKEAALNVFKELLILNPNDNQGIRDYAMIYSLELNHLEDYEKYYKDFHEDHTAFALFNHALYLFIKGGDNDTSRKALEAARHENKHVLNLLVSKKDLPELEESYGIGDKSEAVYYCSTSRHVWQKVPGAIDWLTAVYQKR